MSKKEKRMIVILLIIAVIAIALFVRMRRNKGEEVGANPEEEVKDEFVQVLEDGTRLNTSDKLHETKKFDGMEISNLQLTEKGNDSVLLGTVTNTSNTARGGYLIDIKVIDKQGKEIITLSGIIGELQPGESTQLNVGATFDYANAYDFEISKKK